jgi:hypothetical protein
MKIGRGATRGDQLVRIDGHTMPIPGVFQKVARHPTERQHLKHGIGKTVRRPKEGADLHDHRNA